MKKFVHSPLAEHKKKKRETIASTLGEDIDIDPDVLAWFKRQGARYQSRINAILRAYVQAQKL